MTTKSKAKAKKRPGSSRPKKQQATSAQRIMRERFKAMAAQYRVAGFKLQQITDSINEHYGPGGEGEAELPSTFKFRKISRHLVHDLIVESIKESVDPLLKEQLRDLHIQQHEALLAAAMTPALQGSIAHIASAQSLLRDIAKLTGILDSEDDGNSGGGGITQIFLGGLA